MNWRDTLVWGLFLGIWADALVYWTIVVPRRRAEEWRKSEESERRCGR